MRVTLPSSSKVQTAQDPTSISMPLPAPRARWCCWISALLPCDLDLPRLAHLRLEGVGLHPGAQRLRPPQFGDRPGADEDHVGVNPLGRGVVVAAVERFVALPQPVEQLVLWDSPRPAVSWRRWKPGR